MRLAIIPARGGSKRIKNKNIVDFFGKPLIYYALEAAKKSNLFDKIHVSTDCKKIKKCVENLGYEIDFMREKSLADDYTGLYPVLKWVYNKFKNDGLHFKEIFCIMPCAPLLDSQDLIKAHRIFKSFECKNPLLVATKFNVPIEWAFYQNNDLTLVPVNKKSLIIRSQDIRQAYYECGPFNIFSYKHLENQNLFKKSNYVPYLIGKNYAVDIDDPEDLEYAKVLFVGNKNKI